MVAHALGAGDFEPFDEPGKFGCEGVLVVAADHDLDPAVGRGTANFEAARNDTAAAQAGVASAHATIELKLANIETAKADIAELEQQRVQAQQDLDDCTLYAPYSGRVTRKHVGRGGYLRASGDADPADDRHGTFFQMLPTVRRYAQSASYNQMNSTDLFVQALLRPTESVGVRVDVHRIGLASPRDLWYFGSGATQARGTIFGFGTRPSHGARSLGTVVEGSADYTIAPGWSINGYLGVIRGGGVVRPAFAGQTMTFGYLENVLQF